MKNISNSHLNQSKSKKISDLFLVILILIVVILGAILRLYAANRLHVDHDETTYLIASNKYANYMRSDQFSWLAWEKINFEHPPLNKIIYGVALLTQEPLSKVQQSDLIDEKPIKEQQAVEYAMAGRYVSVGFGVLVVFLLSLINPVAGLFLAVNSLGIKYTSEMYLEALPMLTSLLAVIAYSRFFSNISMDPKNGKKAWLWLAISAVSLGITAASKYIYCVAGLAIGLHWIISVIRKKLPLRSLIILCGWGFFSIFMFFVFDPFLWVHTIERLVKSVNYHIHFQASAHVVNANYPFWQPLLWIFDPFATYSPIHDPHFNDAILFSIDKVIFFFAIIGIPRTFKRYQVFFFWIVIGLVMLFVWGSKWAQYPLIMLAPWCLSAAQGVITLMDLIKHRVLKQPTKS